MLIFLKKTFFELLDMPKSYWNSPSNVDKFVIKPIKEELTPLFRGLTVRKKYGKGVGNQLLAIRLPGNQKRKMPMISHKANYKMSVKSFLIFSIMVN